MTRLEAGGNREQRLTRSGTPKLDSERKVETYDLLAFSWLESRVIRLGMCFDDLLRRLWKIFDKMTYIEKT
jgi:hypothetical protein